VLLSHLAPRPPLRFYLCERSYSFVRICNAESPITSPDMVNIFLVSCSNRKLEHAAPARDLYTSPTFQASRQLAELRGSTWFIISAKHGLLSPETVIAPYDVSLSSFSSEERVQWANCVTEGIREFVPTRSEITFLTDDLYAEHLTSRLRGLGYRIRLPFLGRPKATHRLWLNEVLNGSVRSSHLETFYQLLGVLSKGLGGPRVFDQCSAVMNWPKRGVYFLFEDSEQRYLHESVGRVTRVGTHAVSKGSRSTLWQRLRTHRGTNEGGGNHRSSILRLHVGTALLSSSSDRAAVQTWAQGQSANKHTRVAEKELEKEVSRYIRKMKLLWLSIGDSASAQSDRSYIERNAIALLSGITGTLDVASADWLGTHCANPAVRRSSLWNVDFVDDLYDDQFLDVLSTYVDITLGRRPMPANSIAPKGWHDASRLSASTSQTHLFDGDLRNGIS
jgi:hypothetical protein